MGCGAPEAEAAPGLAIVLLLRAVFIWRERRLAPITKQICGHKKSPFPIKGRDLCANSLLKKSVSPQQKLGSKVATQTYSTPYGFQRLPRFLFYFALKTVIIKP